MTPVRQKTDPSHDSGRHGAVTGPELLLFPLGQIDTDCSSMCPTQTCGRKHTQI